MRRPDAQRRGHSPPAGRRQERRPLRSLLLPRCICGCGVDNDDRIDVVRDDRIGHVVPGPQTFPVIDESADDDLLACRAAARRYPGHAES